MVKKIILFIFFSISLLLNLNLTHVHHSCSHIEIEQQDQKDCCEIPLEKKDFCTDNDACCSDIEHELNLDLDYLVSSKEKTTVSLNYQIVPVKTSTQALTLPTSYIIYEGILSLPPPKNRVQSIFCNFQFYLG